MAVRAVKRFIFTKDCGFIQPGVGSTDGVVHICAVDRSGIGHLRDGRKRSPETGRDSGRGKIGSKIWGKISAKALRAP